MISTLQFSFLLSVPFTLFNSIPFIALVLAFAKPKLNLGQTTMVEIDYKRHQRISLLLQQAYKFFDLPLVQQKFARPFRLVVARCRMFIFRDVQIEQK